MTPSINAHAYRRFWRFLLTAGALTLFSILTPLLSVEAATLSLTPGTGVYTAGGTFTASVVVNTQGAAINAAEGALSFNPQQLSVVGVSKGSMFNLWTVEPTFNNSAGTISFGGGSPGGYTGSAGTVMSVTFRTKGAGTARVSFSNGSVLAADGRGTNVLTSMNGGSYTIAAAAAEPAPEVIEYVAPVNTPAAPTIRSATHPDPSGWYRETTAELSWSLPPGITGVRTLLDGSPSSIPTKVYDDPIDSITIPDLEEGVSYFHVQLQNADGWGRVAHYRLAVDTAPPSRFEISHPEGADLTNPVQTLALVVEDATSPVRRYTVQLDGGEPFEYVDETGSSTLTLPALEPGYHTVIVEALDGAGNGRVATFSFDILAFDRPVFTEYPRELNEGVIPVIYGQTKPRAAVTLTLAPVGSEPKSYALTADDAGVFTFIPEATLSQGVYELTAVATDEYGAMSEPSETVRIAVQAPGYLQVGSLIVSVLSIIVPLIALTFLLIALTGYVLVRLRRFRGAVATESSEVLAQLATEFDALATLLDEEETKLAAARRAKKLTKAEAALMVSLRAQLAAARRRLEKEATDVEDLATPHDHA